MFKIIKELSWFVKKNIFWYLGILFSGVSMLILGLLTTKTITLFYSYIKEDGNLLTKEIIVSIIIRLAIFAVGVYLSVIFKKTLQSYLNNKLNFQLREKFLKEVLYQDKVFFEKYNSGDLIARATGDIMWVRHATIISFNDILNDVVSICLTMGFCLSISPKLTFLSIIPLPLVYLISNVLRPKIRNNWRKVRSAVSDMNDAIMEDVGNVRLIRSFVKEDFSNKKLKHHAEMVYKIEKKNLKINALFGPLFQSISTVSLLIALLVGGRIIINSSEIFYRENLIEFITYLGMLVWPLLDIGLSINSFHQSLVSLDRLNEVYNAPIAVKNKSSAKKLKEIDLIEYKNLSFKYKNTDSYYVLNNINLTIRKGKTLGIVGKTGSGKSTLVQQLLRDYPIYEGELLINHESVENYIKESIRERISVVPQEHILFTRSVVDNILIGTKKTISDNELEKVLEDADFKKDVENLSHGLNTIVGEYGVTLSGGQKQRLSIARAFLKESDLLVLDDSLSAVDGQTEANIISSILEKYKAQAKIIVSHRLTAVQHADEIIVLEKGSIVERGTHKELMANKKWYYTQYLEQLMKVEK